MPGVDRGIAKHSIPTNPNMKPITQKLRRMRSKWALLIKEEIAKQLKAKFLEVIEHPKWLANIVPVPKKDGRVRICVDFRDLNKASSNDSFSLPHIDVLINSAAASAMYSSIDNYLGYNQIMMAILDNINTSFVTK